MCAVPSQPMGRFPWDSHRNDIPMDEPGAYKRCCSHFDDVEARTLVCKPNARVNDIFRCDCG